MDGPHASLEKHMYKIRLAKKEDWDKGVGDMCSAFYEFSNYSKLAPIDKASTQESYNDMVGGGGACVLATQDDKPVGMLGFLISPLPTNKNVLVATEIMWWVVPEHRNSVVANELFDTAESLAKIAYKCDLIAMSKLANSPARLGKWYERRGYTEQDTTYLKEL